MSDSLRPHGLQPDFSVLHYLPDFCSNSCPLSQWCYLTISSSAISFSSCLQSFPASQSFSNESALRFRWPKYWSFSFSISPTNKYSDLISFRMYRFDLFAVQGLSRVSSSATLQKHQFFDTQPSLWYSSHIPTWLLEKPYLWLNRSLSANWCLCFLIHCLGFSFFFFPSKEQVSYNFMGEFLVHSDFGN